MQSTILQRLSILVGLICFFIIPLTGQSNLNIEGKVTDAATGEALLGCTVLLQGTSVGAITDTDGKFSIAARSEEDVLIVSYVGYSSQTIKVGTQRYFEIMLSSQGLELSQVVVVGYGSIIERNLTGAAKVIRTEDFNRGIINSPEQLLQGRVSGVNVVSANGEPGSALQINVRGPGGVRTGSTPLFVLDGLALDNSGTGASTNPLNFLNPDDIESISVLKDASATAIYGARGANGVILIKTKRGGSGQARLSYNGSLGLSDLARSIDLLSADDYLREVAALGGTIEDFGGDTDWQQAVTRTGITHKHNLSITGGTDKLSYYASFGMQQQEGILKNSDLDVYSARFNATQQFWDGRLSLEANLNATRTENLRPPVGSVIGTALSINPTYDAYDEKGDINRFEGVFVNPLLYYEVNKDISKTNRIIASITPSLTIFKGLVYKLNLGFDQSNAVRDFQSIASEIPRQDGSLQTNINENANRLVENYFTYNTGGSNYDLTALLGHSYQRFSLSGRSYSINRFPITDIEPINNPAIGQELSISENRPSGFATINELQSFFSRINLTLKDRYLFTATLRADGSSKFGDNNKYGYFPSFSAAWRISDEPFFSDKGAVSSLKLRLGWGLTGNQEIPSKITQPLFTSTVSSTTSYPLNNTGPYPVGTTFARLANPDIQWEVSNQYNAGLDFELFDGAFSGTFDYFRKATNNILLEVIPADPVQPANTFWTNVADMEIINRGVELDLNYRLRTQSSFTLDLGTNITFIDNEVNGSPYSVIPSGSASGSGLTSATINGYVNGQPIGTFFLREHTGFDEQGLSTFNDVNGDGIITDNDRIAAGTALPNRLYNFNARIGFKGFGLSANMNGVAGNKIYDNTANANFYKLRLSRGLNVTPEAIASPIEAITNAAPVSTRFLKDGAFLRLNNLTLDYSFNMQRLGLGKHVSNISLFVTGQNLLLFTKYDGFDPEVNTDRTINGVLSYGIDYISYPRARSVIFGANIGF